MTSFPSIDLSLFDIGAPWRDQVAAQIDSAASSFGAFLLVGHGVDSGLIDTLLELGGKYVKRGSSSDLPGFHDSVREYATSLTGLGHKLMAAMARGLRLDDGFFADHYTGNPTISLRIGDYPVALSPGGQPDTNEAGKRRLLTIVKLGDAQVLEVKHQDGWIEVPALPCALLCSVGAVLERLTQRHYVCARQRLTRNTEGGRPSLCFVFEPGMGAALTTLARPVVDSTQPHPESMRRRLPSWR